METSTKSVKSPKIDKDLVREVPAKGLSKRETIVVQFAAATISRGSPLPAHYFQTYLTEWFTMADEILAYEGNENGN